MRDLLQAHGVHVVYCENANIETLIEKQSEFLSLLREGDAALVYFAGHGLTFANVPRLLAISTSVNPDVRRHSLNATYFLSQITAKKTSMNVFLLDCCRTFQYKRMRS